MFKNMKLGTRMALGFGVVVVVTALLGFISWRGISAMSATAIVQQTGTKCVDQLNQCAALRRDFAIRGFATKGQETKNAADQWNDAHAELNDRLRELGSSGDLSTSAGEVVQAASSEIQPYKAAFEQQCEAQRMKDDAFDQWGKVGGQVTVDIDKAVAEVITPALAAAQESQQIDEVMRWARISDRLDKNVVQPFLLLRVKAVYLLATDAEAQWKAYQEQLDQVTAGLASWKQDIGDDANLNALAGTLEKYFADYRTTGEQYHQGMVAEQNAVDAMAVVAKKIVDKFAELEDNLTDEMGSVTARTNTLVMGMAIGAVVLGIFAAFLITRSIVKPVTRIIADLTEGATQVTEASSQVSITSQQLAEGASEQASSLEETSSALEEMAAMTRNNANNAKQANNLSNQARGAAQAGDETMGRLNQAMTAINDSSGQISKVIKVIEEIAFQTNLLALNAAVEAARAGEHGKGFAVVAEEVRNLAQRSAEAAGETTTLIEGSVQRAREGTEVAQEVADALSGIVTDVAKVTELINGIAQASDEQAQGVEQVNVAVSQMDKVTQSNAAGAEESASASEELSAQAVAVNGVVGDLAALVGGSANTTLASQKQGAAASTVNHTKKNAAPSAHAAHFGEHGHSYDDQGSQQFADESAAGPNDNIADF